MTPEAKAGLYPSFFIIGIRKEPSEAVSATARPTIAPIEEAGTDCYKGKSPPNMPDESIDEIGEGFQKASLDH
jgi:hypothetical protein